MPSRSSRSYSKSATVGASKNKGPWRTTDCTLRMSLSTSHKSIAYVYTWRFNAESQGGHLFDDVMHKYAMALWLVDSDIRSVQSVVRHGPLFFEAPTVALFEYDRDDLLGMMEVSYAPDMFIRSDHY